MNGQLLLLGNPRDQTLIKANEKLCATVYSRGENVCILLFGGGCCAFSLRNTWYGLEFPSYRDFDDVLVLSLSLSLLIPQEGLGQGERSQG
jgi:hypothetical protein